MAAPKTEPKYALYTDESGSSGDRLRALAGVAGPLRALDDLRLALEAVAARHRVRDLKWAMVRTRPARLEACREYLGLARDAQRHGVRVGVLLWRGEPNPRRGRAPASAGAHALAHLARRSEDMERLRAAYRLLMDRMVAGSGPGAWAFHPDWRTGMDWRPLLARSRRFKAFAMQASGQSALTQLADLAAGMARFARMEARALRSLKAGRRPTGLPARINRLQLALEFTPSILLWDAHDPQA